MLLDLMLPSSDGMELMRGILDKADVPVIFLSVYGQDEVIARAFDQGAVDYIVKPFSPTELAARIRAGPAQAAAARIGRARLTGENQEPSYERHNSNGKLHYSWAVNLDASMLAGLPTKLRCHAVTAGADSPVSRLCTARNAGVLMLCTKASIHKPVTTRLVRRHLWMSPGGFSMSRRDSDSEKVPAALYDRLTDTPTYAARMYKAPLCPRSWPCRGN